MRVTFRVAEPNSGSGAPCGASPVGIEATTYDLKVVVDGTTIVDVVVPFAGFNAGPVNTTNGLVVTGFFYLDPYYAQFDIAGLDIHESTSLEVVVSKTGYFTFSKTFTIYGYDLGNAGSGPNPNFEFILVKDLATGTSEAYTSVIQIPRPLTNQTYLYKNNSAPCTDYVFYDSGLNDVLHGDGFVQGDNSGVPEAFTMECFNPDGNCTSGFDFLSPQWIPSIIVQATHSNCPTDECFNVLNNGQAYSYLDFSNLHKVNVDTVEYYGFNGFTINWETIDIAGGSSNPVTQVFQPIVPTYTFDAVANVYNFTPPNIGDFIVKACFSIREDQDDYKAGTATGTGSVIVQCCKSLVLSGCNTWSVTEKETCGQYEICNKSANDLTITYASMDDTGSFVDIAEIEIDACTCVTVNIDTQGVYKFTTTVTTPTGTEEQNIIKFVDCTYRACIADYIKDIICGGTKDCDDCDDCSDRDYYNFNTLIALAHVYEGIVNNAASVNFLYTVIDSTILNDLYKASQVLERMTLYCEDCVNPCSECN